MSEDPAHPHQNILLSDGTQTAPGLPIFADQPRVKAYLRSINSVVPVERREATSVVDLGCLEGAITVEFARAGYAATGIEVRTKNIERCQMVSDNLRLPNLQFVQDDVRNLERYGGFDIVICAGLLYHLDHPMALIDVIGRVTRKALLLETHYASSDLPPNPISFSPTQLSEVTTNEGVPGRWFEEFSESATRSLIEDSRWASYGNERSFWIEKRYLIQAVRDVGFNLVFEQFDVVDNNVDSSYLSGDHRSLFFALK